MFGYCFVLPVSLLPVMEDGLIKGISQVCHYCHLTIDYICACSGLFICMASFVWRWCSSGYTFPSDTWRKNIFTAACEIPGSLQVCICSCPGKNISGHTLPVKLTLPINLQSIWIYVFVLSSLKSTGSRENHRSQHHWGME